LEAPTEIPVGTEVAFLVILPLAVGSVAVWTDKVYPLYGIFKGVHSPRGVPVEPLVVVEERDGTWWYLPLAHIQGFQIGARSTS
jgi:hypothetical protein